MQNGFRVGEVYHVEPSLNSVAGPAGTTRLEPKAMQVLVCLAKRAGEVVAKEHLIRTVWPDTFVSDDVLTRCISDLRKVLGDDAKESRVIQTIPKSGYRLIADVSPDATAQIAAPAESARRTIVPAHGRKRVMWATGLVAMAVLIIGGFFIRTTTRAHTPKIGRSIQLTYSGQLAAPSTGEDIFPSLVSDGARIYFSQIVGGRWTLAHTSVSGGEVVPIDTPFKDALLLNISPDGSKLLVRDFNFAELENPLWVVWVPGGALRRLGDIVAHDGAWSPDGNSVVVARGEDLYVARSDGTDPRKLVTLAGRAYWLRWSPDGSRMRFTVINRKTLLRSLWEVSAEGHNLHPVLTGASEVEDDSCGDWTPDGRYFVFRRYRDERTDIWAIGEGTDRFGDQGGGLTRLTTGPLHFPAAIPSRDGHWLFVIGTQPRGENLRFDLGTRTFVPYNSGRWAGWFDFSRDEKWVAYVEFRANGYVLWRSRVDGSERLQLTQRPLELLLPRWSPDGKRIAFMARAHGRPWKIYMVAAEGGEPQQIMDGDRDEADPDWAPDGQSLMFGRPPDYLGEPSSPKAIQLLDLTTKKVSTLPGSNGLFGSRWSPSGRFVGAVLLNQSSLRLFDFTTRRWTELASFKTIHNPVWSRDERFLYFQAEEGSLYRVRMSDRAVERVASLGAIGTWKSSYCYFEGLALDDSPLVSCRQADRDLYAFEWEAR